MKRVRAKRYTVDCCYECGQPVSPFEGERHGRSGWIHNECTEWWEKQTGTFGYLATPATWELAIIYK